MDSLWSPDGFLLDSCRIHIGFHNILNSFNNLIFFDFEYSGIDDPCKLIADLVLQPDYHVPFKYIHLIKDFLNIYSNKIPFFNDRFRVILDLYQIKWYVIIFNPIIKKKLEYKNIERIFEKAEGYFLKIDQQKPKLLKPTD